MRASKTTIPKEKNAFPWPSALLLLVPNFAMNELAKELNGAANCWDIIGYGLANLAYVMFLSGLLSRGFRIFGLKHRSHTFFAAFTFFVIGTVLTYIPDFSTELTFAMGMWSLCFFLSTIAFYFSEAASLTASELENDDIAYLILPSWFPVSWLVTAIKWVSLIAIGIFSAWWYAIGLIVFDKMYTSIMPFPYALFNPIFKGRINQLKKDNPAIGKQMETAFRRSRINRNDISYVA